MSTYAVSARVKRTLDVFEQDTLPQAMLLYGVSVHYAEHLASSLLRRIFTDHSSYDIITIKSEDVLKLEDLAILQMTLKTKHTLPTFIFVHFLESMTVQAQNTLLKVLEEPPKNVHFVLICETITGVLATIKSRSQQFKLTYPSLDELKVSMPEISMKEYILSGGDPLLISAGEVTGTSFALAKEFLISSHAKRTALIQEAKLTRTQAQEFISSLVQTLLLIIRSKSAKSQEFEKELIQVDACLNGYQKLAKNVGVKTELMLLIYSFNSYTKG